MEPFPGPYLPDVGQSCLGAFLQTLPGTLHTLNHPLLNVFSLQTTLREDDLPKVATNPYCDIIVIFVILDLTIVHPALLPIVICQRFELFRYKYLHDVYFNTL